MLHIVQNADAEGLGRFLQSSAFRLHPNAFVNAEGDRRRTPLLEAIRQQSRFKTQMLLDVGAKPMQTDVFGRTAFHVAAAEGGVDVMRLLLDVCGPSVLNLRDSRFGGTPLHDAAAAGQDAVVELLLDAHAFIDEKTNTGDTALHRAIACHRTATVRLLLDRGASVFVKREDGTSPLQLFERTPGLHAALVEDMRQATRSVPSLVTLATNALRLLVRRNEIPRDSLPPRAQIAIGIINQPH